MRKQAIDSTLSQSPDHVTWEEFRVLERIGIAISIVDAHTGRFVKVNRRFCEITGYSCEELWGRTFDDITHTDDVLIGHELTQQMLAGQICSYTVDKRYVRKDGQIIWAQMMVSPIWDENGEPTHNIGIINEITEQAHQEAAQQQVAELERQVAQRTAELLEKEAALQAANQRLKELDRMKNQFITDVSHELRTPITTIKLYASLLRNGPADKSEKFLSALEQEANRLVTLIKEILEISRIESGRLDLRQTLHDLNDLTQASVANREILAVERGITLDYIPQPRGLWVWVDGVRMMEVIDNLIENALKYTPSGGQVEVATGVTSVEGRLWATLRVRDTGAGISADELPHIFDRFYRGRKPREAQLSGSGLGLAIAREIVLLHQGYITVESQLNVGSTFTVWLPIAQGQTDELRADDRPARWWGLEH